MAMVSPSAHSDWPHRQGVVTVSLGNPRGRDMPSSGIAPPLHGTEGADAGTALGSVTITRADDTQEDRGQLTRVDTAKLAIEIFGGSATRIDPDCRWGPSRQMDRTGPEAGPTHGP